MIGASINNQGIKKVKLNSALPKLIRFLKNFINQVILFTRFVMSTVRMVIFSVSVKF